MKKKILVIFLVIIGLGVIGSFLGDDDEVSKTNSGEVIAVSQHDEKNDAEEQVNALPSKPSSENSVTEQKTAPEMAEKEVPQQPAPAIDHPKTYGTTVYHTPTGKCYHRDQDCGGKNSSPIDLDRAISIGLTPCKKCAQ